MKKKIIDKGLSIFFGTLVGFQMLMMGIGIASFLFFSIKKVFIG